MFVQTKETPEIFTMKILFFSMFTRAFVCFFVMDREEESVTIDPSLLVKQVNNRKKHKRERIKCKFKKKFFLFFNIVLHVNGKELLMKKWRRHEQSELTDIYPLVDGKDPFEEQKMYASDEVDEKMIMDGGIDNPALRYFTQLMREQVCPKINQNKNCVLRWKTWMCAHQRIPLRLEMEHSVNPDTMVYVAKMFARVGYDVELYWNAMPNGYIKFRKNGDVITDHLLSVHEMYVTQIKDTDSFIKGGMVVHKIHRNTGVGVSTQYREEKEEEENYVSCLIQ